MHNQHVIESNVKDQKLLKIIINASVKVEQCCATVDDPWLLDMFGVCNVSKCVCGYAHMHARALTYVSLYTVTHTC